MLDGVATRIIDCIQCQQKLRVPANIGTILITCPKCTKKWSMFTGDRPRSNTHEKDIPPRDSEVSCSRYRIVDIAQGTPAWLSWRNQGVGASDAPAIMGENPWKSRVQVLKEKLSGRSFGPNEAMARGTALEPEARNRYQRLTGIKVRPVCLQSTQCDWLRASIDGLAYDGSSVVEIKCGKRVYEHASSKRQIPKYYFGQVQHILAVTGLSRIDFWCYWPGCPEVRLCVDRDNSYIQRLIEAEQGFWQEFLRHKR